jgi:uncharacterized Zn finger protein
MIEYKYVNCPSCQKELRLTIREASIGKEVDVKCGVCGKIFRTTLSTDATQKLRLLEEEFTSTVKRALKTNAELEALTEKAKQAGYDPVVVLAMTVRLTPRMDEGMSRLEIRTTQRVRLGGRRYCRQFHPAE